jgi:hypothetical protein
MIIYPWNLMHPDEWINCIGRNRFALGFVRLKMISRDQIGWLQYHDDKIYKNTPESNSAARIM